MIESAVFPARDQGNTPNLLPCLMSDGDARAGMFGMTGPGIMRLRVHFCRDLFKQRAISLFPVIVLMQMSGDLQRFVGEQERSSEDSGDIETTERLQCFLHPVRCNFRIGIRGEQERIIRCAESGMTHGVASGTSGVSVVGGIGDTHHVQFVRQLGKQGKCALAGIVLRVVDPEDDLVRLEAFLSGQRQKAGNDMLGLVAGRNGDDTPSLEK
ncbi:hypothetical protein AAJCM20276_21720 [Acetobacter aceti]|uniref:Uncharacterized protein n=1 Tax=Acetobacter aceti TaxID=435 RepID=A0A6S6PID0_ACEAC|nr:hypothetical protein AAJCM20276_21720 [Acetobacter aceti]